MYQDFSYAHKKSAYFDGARKLFVDDLPINPSARLLEIGCGTGETGSYALEQGKCGWCCGVELVPAAVEEARTKLQMVIQGDIEKINIDFPEEYFDVLILSEVLEHLVEPWSVLRSLRGFLKPGAQVRAGSPNVAHYSTLLMLLRGRWDLASAGIMDSTHLRWFTPASYKTMFEECGYVVENVKPARRLNPKALLLNTVTGKRWEYLLHSQIYLKACRP